MRCTNGRNTALSGRSLPCRSSDDVHTQHSAVSDATFHQGRRAIIEAREDLRVFRRRHRTIRVEPRAGEVAAAGRAERFEDRIAVFERAEPRRLSGGAIDRLPRRGGKNVRRSRGGRPRRAAAKRNQQTAAACHECAEPFGGQLRHRRIVEDDDRGALQIVGRDRSRSIW